MMDYTDPASAQCNLSPECQAALREIFTDVVRFSRDNTHFRFIAITYMFPPTQTPAETVDYHVHLVGHGDSGSGCYLHRKVTDKSHVHTTAAHDLLF